jgi:hypothetical protein
MASQAPRLPGEQDKNGLSNLLRRVRVAKDAHGGSVHQSNVTLHDLSECPFIGFGDEATQAFGIGS